MAFFAIPIPGELQIQLHDGLASLKKDWPDVQWVHPEDYHFTLRFLGGLHAEDTAQLLTAIQGQGLPFTSFALKLQGISYFPPHRDRGVLWIGMENIPPELIDLQERLEQQVQALGFHPETRAFTPHLTIGRFKRNDNEGLMQALPAFTQRGWGGFTCHEYVLMKRRYGARDRSNQPLYEVLTRFPV
jgi:2'-5' RNA ligase